MKQSQLRAISYAYSEKKRRADRKQAEELGINLIYSWNSVYKTLGGFVNAYGTKNFEKAVRTAKEALEERAEKLKKCGCTSWKVEECQDSLKQCNNYLDTL